MPPIEEKIQSVSRHLVNQKRFIFCSSYVMWTLFFINVFPFYSFIFADSVILFLGMVLFFFIHWHRNFLTPIAKKTTSFPWIIRQIEKKNPALRGYLTAYTANRSGPSINNKKTNHSIGDPFYAAQIKTHLISQLPDITFPSLNDLSGHSLTLKRIGFLSVWSFFVFSTFFGKMNQPFADSFSSAKNILRAFNQKFEIQITKITIYPPFYSQLATKTLTLADIEQQNYTLSPIAGSKIQIELSSVNKTDLFVPLMQFTPEKTGKPLLYSFAPLIDNSAPWNPSFIATSNGIIAFVNDADRPHIPAKEKLKIILGKDKVPTVQVHFLNEKPTHSDQDTLILDTNSQDDFGIVALEISYQINNPTTSYRETIRKFTFKPRTTYDEKYRWNLSNIPLKSGDHITFWVEATDNDLIQGPNVGRSKVFEIKIKDAHSKHLEAFETLRQIQSQLLSNLADLLTIDENSYRFAQIANRTRTTAQDLRRLMLTMYRNPLIDTFLLGQLQKATNQYQEHYNQLAAVADKDKKEITIKSVTIHEDLIYLIHDIIQNQEIANIMNRSEDFFTAFRKMEKLIADYKKNPSPELKEKIQRAMQELKAYLSEMKSAMRKKYAEMSLVSPNQEAIQRHANQDFNKLLDKMQNALSSNDLQDIEKELGNLMDQYSKSVRDMSTSISQYNASKYDQLLKDYNELMTQAQKAIDQQKEAIQQFDPDDISQTRDKQKQVEALVNNIQKQLKTMEGTLMNASQLSKIPQQAQQSIKQTYQEMKAPNPVNAKATMKKTTDHLSQLKRQLKKIGKDMNDYLKNKGKGNNRQKGTQFGKHVISEPISLEHTFEVDKQYRDDVIDAMREPYPESSAVDIDLYYKRVIK